MSPKYRSQKSILTQRNRRRRMFLEALEDRRLLTVSTPQLMTLNFAGNNTGNASTLLNEQVLSGDGRYLVFASTASNLVNNDTNGALSDVYLRDLQTNTITIVSKRAGGGTPDGASDHPAISPDGNFVAFASYASDLDVTGTNSNNGQWQVYRWSRATGEIRLVSINTDGTNGGDNTSWVPSISADGSRISFTTAASNLASGVTDTNGNWDVYYRNLTTSVTTLVSRSAANPLLPADSYSSEPSRMSRDGSTIVYSSTATNLEAGTSDLNLTGRDIVSYDIATGLNRYVSVETAAPSSGNSYSWRSNEALSADGVYEVFMSYASDLAPNDFNGSSDVFLRNNVTGVTTLISRTTSGTSAAGASDHAVISADGNYVAFASTASDLNVTGTNPYNGNWQVFRWSRLTGVLEAVSLDESGAGGGNSTSWTPSISGDGSKIAYLSTANNLIPGFVHANGDWNVFLRNFSTSTTALVSHSAGAPLISGNGQSGQTPKVSLDGSRVVYLSRASDLQAGVSDINQTGHDVIIYNVAANTNQYASLQTATASSANTGSSKSEQSLSADGLYEVFWSTASDLVPNDLNNNTDVFLRNNTTGAITLISRNAAGKTASGGSHQAVISADGNFVAFASIASDLDVTGTNPYNGNWAVYRWSRLTGEILPISFNSDGTSSPNNATDQPTISGNGSRIAYVSYGTDVVAGQVDINGSADVFLTDVIAGTTILVSHAFGSNITTGDSGSGQQPLISRDGSTISYPTRATNLQAGVSDINGTGFDLAVYSVATGLNRIASVQTTAASSGNADSSKTEQALSADGRYQVFSSNSNNLVSTDFNATTDVFLRDNVTGSITLISRNSSGRSANGASYLASISSDGNYVAFVSSASDLDVTGSSAYNGYWQVYRWSRSTGEILSVSLDGSGTTGGTGHSELPSISGDGSKIAWRSYASDLVAGQNDLNGWYDIFIRDMNTSVTAIVSHLPSDPLSTSAVYYSDQAPKISRDGSTVAYASRAYDLQTGVTDINQSGLDMILYNVATGANQYASLQSSAPSTGNAGANKTQQSISADGNFEVFESNSNNLAPNDLNGTTDVFIRDNASGTITLISRTVDGSSGNSNSFQPVISADGNYVAFISNAQNLNVTGTSLYNGYSQLYRWSRLTNTIEPVSINIDGTSGGNYFAEYPSISGDGSRIAFRSAASDLVAGVSDANGWYDVFLRDMNTFTTTLVSRSVSDPLLTGNAPVDVPVISQTGEIVVYRSTASDVTSEADANGTWDLFAFDIATGLNTLVNSSSISSATSNLGAGVFSISLNGKIIAFESSSSDLDPLDTDLTTDIFVRDLGNSNSKLVSLDSSGTSKGNAQSNLPSISGDGRYVAFVSYSDNLVAGDTNGQRDAFVRDRNGLGSTTRISVSSTGVESNSDSPLVMISSDGSMVAFESYASNLDATVTDANSTSDVFTRDWQAASPTTRLISRDTTGLNSGNSFSQTPELSTDGSLVYFASSASDISPITDANGSAVDLFVFDGTNVNVVARKDVSSRYTGQSEIDTVFSLSDDGTLVSYSSRANGMVDDSHTAGYLHSYIFDAATTENERVSVSDLGVPGDSDSYYPSVSGDGRYVAFETNASNLGPNDTGLIDIYVRDRLAGTTTRVSVTPAGSQADFNSFRPILSNDGNMVAFNSDATNLDGLVTDTGSFADVFVRNWKAASPVTRSLSTNVTGTTSANNQSTAPVLSDNGIVVLFDSSATNIVTLTDSNGFANDLFVYNGSSTRLVAQKDTTTLFTGQSEVDLQFSMSNDGRFVAYSSRSNGLVNDSHTAGYWHVYVSDRNTLSNERISVSSDEVPGEFHSYWPSISGDGRYVAFESQGNNLVAGDTGRVDAFVRDRVAGTTTRVSVATGGNEGDGDSSQPRISNDGSTVAFYDTSSDLDTTVTDSNTTNDVFVRNWKAASPVTKLISKASTGNQSANNWSGIVVMSDSGQRIVFESQATDLTSILDSNGTGIDLFYWNGTNVELITRKNLSVRYTGQSEVDVDFSISSTGRYVAYSSRANAMVDDTHLSGHWHAYVVDANSLTNERVSVASDETPGNWHSYYPSISGDGSFVAFESQAANLVDDDLGSTDAFVRNRLTGTTVRVNLTPSGAQADNEAYRPVLSRDGSKVAFTSYATDLDNSVTDSPATLDVFVRDWNSATPTTKLISKKFGASLSSDGQSSRPIVSDDGSSVLYQTTSTDIVGLADANGPNDDLVVYRNNTNLLVSQKSTSGRFTGNSTADSNFSISDDGRYVAFLSSAAGLANDSSHTGYANVFVSDRSTADNVRISVDSDENPANWISSYPHISGDGRYVAFTSDASNLVVDDTNGTTDVFVRDRVATTTTRVSVGTGDVQGDSTSQFGRISRDGSTVAFLSYASNLDPNVTDSNATQDVFLRKWNVSNPSTDLVSRRASAAESGDSSAIDVTISANGTSIAFTSAASNLTTIPDTNDTYDVFAVKAANVKIGPSSISQLEPDTGTINYTFTITREWFTAGGTTLQYNVQGFGPNPANAADFGGTFPSGTVVFANGETSKNIQIAVSGERNVELDEGFIVVLSDPTENSQITVPSATGTILNNDIDLVIAADASASAFEGDSGNKAFTFTVTRLGYTGVQTTVNYAVSGAAVTAADFGGTLPTGTVTFPIGSTSQTITLNVSGDLDVEADEAFTVTLSGQSGNADINTATANGLIRNDDADLAIATATSVALEGDAGNKAFTFTVSKTGYTGVQTTVNFAVAGAAVTASDFGGSLPSGVVTFPIGSNSQTITINVSGDLDVESDEAFTVTLSGPSGNQQINTASVNGLIQNDDIDLTIAANANATALEGDSGNKAYTFTVNRLGYTGIQTTVNYAVSGAAVNAADFGGTLPSGVVTFPVGSTSQVITVNVSGDLDVEADEAFTVTLSAPSDNQQINTASANGLIQNNDIDLTIAANANATALEGDSGNKAYTFTVNRLGYTGIQTTVNYAVSGAAVNAADFGGTLPSGVVTFPVGSLSQVITVNVSGDLDIEADEAFTVTLSGPSDNQQINTASANGLIQNNDKKVTIAANPDAVQVEGNSGLKSFTFAVTRTGYTGEETRVDYAVSGSVNAADFGGVLPSGTVTFPIGSTSQTITIQVSGDTDAEIDEMFVVTLSNPNDNTQITVPTANGTILNDDGLATVEAAIVGDGTAQRSMVNRVVIQFSGQVDIDAGAFQVTRIGGPTIPTSFTTAINGAGKTVATITFSGVDLVRGTMNALMDGNYVLVIDATKVRIGSNPLDGDNDGTAGGNYVFGDAAADKFFTLYGDVNGDRIVTVSDFNSFRESFGRSVGHPLYRPELDYNGDGTVAPFDFNEFRKRFGKSV